MRLKASDLAVQARKYAKDGVALGLEAAAAQMGALNVKGDPTKPAEA